MFTYEKNNALNIELNNKNQIPSENPDIVINKTGEDVEILVDGKNIVNGGGEDPNPNKVILIPKQEFTVADGLIEEQVDWPPLQYGSILLWNSLCRGYQWSLYVFVYKFERIA